MGTCICFSFFSFTIILYELSESQNQPVYKTHHSCVNKISSSSNYMGIRTKCNAAGFWLYYCRISVCSLTVMLCCKFDCKQENKIPDGQWGWTSFGMVIFAFPVYFCFRYAAILLHWERFLCLMNCISFEWIQQVILQLRFDIHISLKRIGFFLSFYTDAELDSFL